MSAQHWFSRDYKEASSRFRDQLSKLEKVGHKVTHQKLELDYVGPSSEDLVIDIAIIGPIQAEKMFLYSSGIHGVEGFAGSAIQLSVLDQLSTEKPFNSYCIIFIHIINPYGMAWFRRVNENNVDLNRNFLNNQSDFSGEPDGYNQINEFLNPSHIPVQTDMLFYLKGVIYLIKYGFKNLKQWIAQGQYGRPYSLQFGGIEMQKGPKLLMNWLQENISHMKEAVAVDLHTGLGPSGYDTILIPDDIDEYKYEIMKNIYQDHIAPLDPNKGIGYKIKGDIHSGISSYFSNINWIYVTQEFGTYSPTKVFKNLRAENMWTQNSTHEKDEKLYNHWSRRNLMRTFNPDDNKWKLKIISRGLKVFNNTRAYLIKI